MRNWVTAGLIGTAALLAPALALAGGSAPQRACAGMAEAYPVSDLVLGHFAGGRYIQTGWGSPILDWRDDHTCFTSARACRAWQRDMRIAFRQVEGDRTCLPLR